MAISDLAIVPTDNAATLGIDQQREYGGISSVSAMHVVDYLKIW